jgi:Fe-S oxidoreductase
MKVLLVTHDLGFADPLAIACLSPIAKEMGHQTFFCALDSGEFIPTVEAIKPDVIGYSVNVIGFKKTIEANHKAAKVHKFVSIMGGPHPTFSPETFTESGMDAYCVGEGEYPFRDFLKKVEKGASFDDVANLITRNKTNPIRPFISNLDEFPMPDRDLVFTSTNLRYSSRKIFVVSRGCPFKCAYCYNSYYRKIYQGKGPAVRRFGVERIIREIEDVKNKCRMDFVKFSDDCFAFKADDWLEEFAEKYSTRIGVPFNCYLRVDTINENILKLLRKAGCYSVMLSVDSVSRHIREDILKREMLREDIIERLRKIREYGINTVVNYMLAVPGSTLQDDLDTITFSKKARVTYPSYTTTVPMKNTDLYSYATDVQHIDPEYLKSDMSDIVERSPLPCFSEKEKDIRYNILLLGALILKLPFPLDRLAVSLLKVIPPNILFKKINDFIVSYSYSHSIFKLKKDNLTSPRVFKQSGAK